MLTRWQELGFFALGHPEVRFHSQHCGLSHHFSAYFSLFKGLIFNVVTTAFVCPNGIKKYCWTSTVSNIAFSLSGWVYTRCEKGQYCTNSSAQSPLCQYNMWSHCCSSLRDILVVILFPCKTGSSYQSSFAAPCHHHQWKWKSETNKETLSELCKCTITKLMLCSEDAVKNSFAPLFALLDQDEHLQEEEQRWRASKKDRFIYFRNTRSPAAPTLYFKLFVLHSSADSSLYTGTDYLCIRWHQAGLYIVPLM